MMEAEHYGPEVASLRAAWDGALGFQKQAGNDFLVDNAMTFDEVNEHLVSIGFTLFDDKPDDR